MDCPRPRHADRLGATLMEAVIAVAVLAVAIPMVFGSLAESGKSGLAARAETRSAWIIPTCMDEIRASRAGHPCYFTATTAGQPFPEPGDIWALAFSADGQPVGKITKPLYESGIRELNGQKVAYVTVINAAADTFRAETTPMLRVDITLEYPAANNARRRAKLNFHTHIR